MLRQLDKDAGLTIAKPRCFSGGEGYTLPEVAQQLGLSRHTVATHIRQIYRKLDVSSRAEATLEAARRGLVIP